MSAWWGREATAGDAQTLSGDGTPILYAGDRASVAAEVRARIAAYTPAWSRRGEDAGEALVRLFGEQVEALLGRLKRWPEKALVEFLSTAGVAQRPARPASTVLTFGVAASAPQSVLVPAGFQVGAQPAGGGELVTFETDRDLLAAPASIAALLVEENGNFSVVPGDPAPPSWLPFGEPAENGRGLWIGFQAETPPAGRVSLGFNVWAPPGTPPPVAAGGVVDLPLPPGPLLLWQLLDGTRLQPLEATFDGTAGLVRSGVIELSLTRSWTSGQPQGSAAPSLRWLRLGIAAGRYETPPRLSSLLLNCVPASATVTVRDEVLEPVATGARSYRLARRPVLPGSLTLSVDEGDDLGVGLGGAGEADRAPGSGSTWSEVADLSPFGPDDRVFALDGALGIVYVGDGVHGAAVPPGFRNVVARRYRVGGGASGAVEAGAITTLLSAAPFVTEVSNARAASGGDDVEALADAVRRGPQELRARGRAVSLADYELMALGVPSGDVRRAHALSGHPAFPGARLTGVVGVLVVPADRGEGPPTPDAPLLEAVARHLARSVAPLGVEVVAATPLYHRVRVEARVLLDPAADVGQAVERVLATLDRFLHPLTGGEEGQGWPFGGTLRHSELLRQVVALEGVLGAPRLDLVVDGELAGECADVAIGAHALVWPEPHLVVPIDAGDEA